MLTKTALLTTALDVCGFVSPVAEKADSRDSVLSRYSNHVILGREDYARHFTTLGLALCNTG